MNNDDLAARIRQAVRLKDRKAAAALLAIPAARTATYKVSLPLAEAVDNANAFLRSVP